MIKRLSLSLQIAIILLVAFFITYFIATYIILGSLDSFFESNIFDQLESEAKELTTLQNDDLPDINPQFAYISYSSQSNIYSTSDNISGYLNEAYTELLINKAATQNSSISHYKNIINDTEIYYAVLSYESFYGLQNNNVFILLTDSRIKEQMIESISQQILLTCLFAYLLGYLLIFLWTSRLVSDTKKITNSLNETGKDYYKTKITTKRNDEIGDLVNNIEHMREKIVQSEQQKQEIIQGVSHDLKTPIAIIRSYAEALEDGIYSAKDVSNITLKQCDRLNVKVKKLLTLTRIGYLGMNNQDFGKTDMEKLLLDTAEIYSAKSKIKINTDIQSTLFKGDDESWRIVLENLLDNALRYSKSHIEITLKANRLSVYNDGDPIPQETIDAIFNPYEKGKGGNYGLGLAIVKNTVNLFGYDVSVQNTNDGVAFTIK